MRTIAVAVLLAVLLGCAQPGTPISEHQNRGLPRGFPADFPLHVQFSIEGTPRKLHWDAGDYFVVKFVTDLKPDEIHYFFRKELGTDRGYKILHESGTPAGEGFLVFQKNGRRIEVTFGREKGKGTILLRLRERK